MQPQTLVEAARAMRRSPAACYHVAMIARHGRRPRTLREVTVAAELELIDVGLLTGSGLDERQAERILAARRGVEEAGDHA